MFLDDQLYEYATANKIGSDDGISYSTLSNDLFDIVYTYYTKRIEKEKELLGHLTYGVVSLILDQAFRSWDLCITKLRKQEKDELSIIATFMEAYGFKEAFLSNSEMKELYLKGK